MIAAMEFPPEDILAEILLRLPEKTLFRFKCVSKQWRSFISDPNFADHYIENSRSSPESWIVHCRLLSWPSFGPDIDSGVHQGKILASSNGLILSTPDPNAVTNLELHVSNPLTNQSAQLPLLSCPFSQCAFGFVQNLGTYKVVVIQRAVGPDLAGSLCSSIEMFDSETGRWSSKKEHVSCPEVLLDYNGEKREGFAYKGVVHWLQLHCGSRTIVTYDPYNSPGRFGRIELPESSGMLGVLMTQLCRRGSSLRYGELVELNYAACGLRKFRMRVWRLEEYGGGEWVPEEQRICTKSNGGGSGYQFVCRPVGKEDAEEVLQLYNRRSFRSVVMCPWSSPLYGIPR